MIKHRPFPAAVVSVLALPSTFSVRRRRFLTPQSMPTICKHKQCPVLLRSSTVRRSHNNANDSGDPDEQPGLLLVYGPSGSRRSAPGSEQQNPCSMSVVLSCATHAPAPTMPVSLLYLVFIVGFDCKGYVIERECVKT